MGQETGGLDRGLTHVAFVVGDLDASIDFYARYAAMKVVHQRTDPHAGSRVAWVSDQTRPFVLVLIEIPGAVPARHPVGGSVRKGIPSFAHLGVGCSSRAEVDELCEQARREGVLERAPADLGPPVGYFGLILDPDGNSLEVSHGQEVGLTVAESVRR